MSILNLHEIFAGRIAKQARAGADPPLAIPRLHRDVLKHPAGLLQSARHEPAEILVVIAAKLLLVLWLIKFVLVNFGGPRKHEGPKTNAAFAITKDVVDCGNPVLVVVSEKTVTFEFHRSGHIRAQPEIAAHVFVQRGDLMKAKTATSRVRPKRLVTLGRVGKKLEDRK